MFVIGVHTVTAIVSKYIKWTANGCLRTFSDRYILYLVRNGAAISSDWLAGGGRPVVGSAGAVPSPMSRAFLDRAERITASDDDDTATAQVVERMTQHIQTAAADPYFQAFARDLVLRLRGGPGFDQSIRDPFSSVECIASSAWWWCKLHLKFVHHNKLMHWYNLGGGGYQLLISPQVIVAGLHDASPDIRERSRRGDCAIYTMMCAAILQACGVPYEIVTVAVNPNQPDIFSHVFLYAVLPDGRRLAIDASHGKYPGWSAPAEHRTRTQVWNSSAVPVADRAGRFRGLHSFVMRPGLGQEPGESSVDLSALYPGGVSPAGADWSTPSPVPIVGNTAPGYDYGALFGGLAKQGLDLVGRMVAPSTTYTRNRDGSVSLVTPGSSPSAVAAAATGVNITGAGGGSLLWIGGGVVALFVIMSLVNKK